jgi:4-hydroxybenzoate polyprenyltransferase
MVLQTFQIVLHTPAHFELIAFIFFSTICSYSFHWYLTSSSVLPSPRVHWLLKYRNVHLFLFITGLVGSVIFVFYLISIWPWLLLSAIVTFLYSAPKIPHPYFRALRKVALGKTIFLAFVWMYVTTILPIVVSGQEWNNVFLFFILSRFFLIYAICILFDYRDREDDKASGIRSLITYLDEKGVRLLFSASLVIFAISTACLLNYGETGLTVGLLLVPGVITALIYKYAIRNFSDLFFYLFLDGLMALSAILTGLARI